MKKGLSLLLVLCLVLGMSLISFGNSNTVTATVTNIKVFINGVEKEFIGANGKPANVIAVDGVSYVPLASIAQSFDKDVKWDGDTMSIHIGDKTAVVEEQAPSDVIHLKNGEWEIGDEIEAGEYYIYWSDGVEGSFVGVFKIKDGEQEVFEIEDNTKFKFENGMFINTFGMDVYLSKMPRK